MAAQPPYAGRITFEGKEIQSLRTEDIVRMGVIYVPEDRKLFKPLSVEENLLMGAYTLKDEDRKQANLEFVYNMFPALRHRRTQPTATMSGGEQQMVAIGRGLMARPKLMLLDEPSLGLAPLLVEEIFDIIRRLNREEKVTVLLVEQNAAAALTLAQYAYIMENGRIVMDGPADVVRDNPDVKEFYLGLTEVGARRSYRDVKHYRRRKRWLS